MQFILELNIEAVSPLYNNNRRQDKTLWSFLSAKVCLMETLWKKQIKFKGLWFNSFLKSTKENELTLICPQQNNWNIPELELEYQHAESFHCWDLEYKRDVN